MDGVTWIDARKLDRNIKATVHKSGKLGFTMEAANKLKLESRKAAKIGVIQASDKPDSEASDLVVIFFMNPIPDGFKVSRAGAYYYINTRPLFDDLRIDYKSSTVAYDIVQEDEKFDDMPIYRFKMRTKKTPLKTGSVE